MSEQHSASSRSPRRRRRRVAVPLGLAVSIVLIVAGDRWLRGRQDLVRHLATSDAQVLLPMSEYLRERVGKKTTWNDLHERVRTASAARNDKAFYDSAYELTKFMADEVGPDDRRRRELLLQIVAYAPESPEAASAYWELFNPAWRDDLRSQYPRYAAILTDLARSTGGNRLMELARLADEMRQLGEADLELKALRQLRSAMPVNLLSEQAMRRLLDVLPAGDPAREALAADIAAFELHRQQLRTAAAWYGEFERQAAQASAEEVERLRAAAPQGPANAFLVSADARLIDAYLRAGRYPDAQALRRRIAVAEPGDMEEALIIAEELAQESIDPQNPPSKPPTGAPPDAEQIAYHRWRGMLLSGQFAEAEQAAAAMAGKDKTVATAADEERALVAGDMAKLSPRATLEPRTSGLPAELADAQRAWTARMELEPAGKAVAAEIKSWVELWVSKDKVLIIAHAEEPRTLRSATTRPHDADLSREEHFQFVFNPDRWFGYQYVIDVSRAGSITDAIVRNNGTIQRRQYRGDRGVNLDAEATVEQDAAGWTLRLLLPRDQVFPPGTPAIRFNARRTRWITEKNQRTMQHYTWSPKAPTGDQRLEHLGWVVVNDE